MKHPELAVIWVSNSKVELKRKWHSELIWRADLCRLKLDWGGGGNPTQLLERQQRAKEYASVGPYVA
jgi:hypothetical protein